jgi:hypothetical protein
VFTTGTSKFGVKEAISKYGCLGLTVDASNDQFLADYDALYKKSTSGEFDKHAKFFTLLQKKLIP